MNALNEDKAEKVKEWVAFADEDLKLARYVLGMEDECPYRLVAYHAQQCAEKYLKSCLVMRGVDFPYTHNIAHLLELCNESGTGLEELEDAEELTPYAITARYPGEDEQVEAEEAKEAIRIATHVRQVVRYVLINQGMTDLPGEE